MSGSIGYEFASVTVVQVPCLGAVIRFARVDPTDGRDVAFLAGGTFGYSGTALGVLEAFGGETVEPLVASLLLVTAVAIGAGRLGRA